MARAKLFPPIVESSLPAFYVDDNKNISITIPFVMNATVAKGEVAGIALIIKSVQNTELFTKKVYDNIVINGFNSSVVFNIKASEIPKVLPGEYYKLQIAYIDKGGVVGNYSQVGVARCTCQAKVSLNTPTSIHTDMLLKGTQIYTGYYQCQDELEKEYSYKFSIIDSSGKELYSTGELIHNVSNDEGGTESQDIWQFDADFAELQNEALYAVYEVKTMHGLIYQTTKQRVLSNYGCPPDENVAENLKLSAIYNEEDGAVEIYANSGGHPISGFFILKRSKKDERGKFFIYEPIETFGCNNVILRNQFLCQDLTVESGQTYRYRIQQFNANGVYSTFLPIANSVSITPYYEDMFLYDGERQLRIRFNPQVSSFKADILMTKTDTIGNRYPHIFRNGIVNYKEFPINGLISYQMDPNEKFCSKAELGLLTGKNCRNQTIEEDFFEPIKPGDQVAENIEAERRFKIKVLDFLNNGKNKLFRSPTEGNFLVQLMNTSLSPQQSLARMIHSFQSTAYEIGPATNLTTILRAQTEGYEESATRLWFSTANEEAFKSYNINKNGQNVIGFGEQIYELLFQDYIPGTIFSLTVVQNGVAQIENIIIGSTGAYHYLANSNNTYISGLAFYLNRQIVPGYSGKMRYSLDDYLRGGSVTAPSGKFMMATKFNNIIGYTINENFGEIYNFDSVPKEKQFYLDDSHLGYQWLTGSDYSATQYKISSIPLVRAINDSDRIITFLWTSSSCTEYDAEIEDYVEKKANIRKNIPPTGLVQAKDIFSSKIMPKGEIARELDEETFELFINAICKTLPTTVYQTVKVVRSFYKKVARDNKIYYDLVVPKRSQDSDEEYLDDIKKYLDSLLTKLCSAMTVASLGDYHMVTLLPGETRDLIVQAGPEIQNIAFIAPYGSSYQSHNLKIEIYSAGVSIYRAPGGKGGTY